jgi:hypothetical protein
MMNENNYSKIKKEEPIYLFSIINLAVNELITIATAIQ